MAGLLPLVQQIFVDQILHEEISFFLAVNTAATVEVLLYGVHLSLFCVCMFILLRNQRTTQWFILISAVLMFALSTADIGITLRLLTHDIVRVFDPAQTHAVLKLVFVKNPIFASNNLVADLVLLYRCYMIWGKSKYVLIGASFLVLADTVWGYVGLGQSLISPDNTFVPLYVWSIFAINILLAITTAGRIYWVTRIARNFLGRRQRGVYHTAIAVIMESSVVYSACILVYVVYPRHLFSRMIIITICMRVVAIMPTLLIVQVGLDRAVRADEEAGMGRDSDIEMKSDFVARSRPTSVVLDTVIISMDTNSPPSRSHPQSVVAMEEAPGDPRVNENSSTRPQRRLLEGSQVDGTARRTVG